MRPNDRGLVVLTVREARAMLEVVVSAVLEGERNRDTDLGRAVRVTHNQLRWIAHNEARNVREWR